MNEDVQPPARPPIPAQGAEAPDARAEGIPIGAGKTDAPNLLQIVQRLLFCVALAGLCGVAWWSFGDEELPELVLIPAGEFRMGSHDAPEELQAIYAIAPRYSTDEFPCHPVRITRPFYLGVYEVTQREFRRRMQTNPSTFMSGGIYQQQLAGVDTNRLPVETVSWFDALEFCNALSAQARLKSYYSLTKVARRAGSIAQAEVAIRGGNGFRLPTEAEWEYACRGGTVSRYYFGDSPDELGEHAWYVKNSSQRPEAVGQKSANPFGLYDMLGNVAEWCEDGYDKTCYERGATAETSDPLGPATADVRVYRGGSWILYPAEVRTSRRTSALPALTSATVGIRVARNP